jgi:hypothetical protein
MCMKVSILILLICLPALIFSQNQNHISNVCPPNCGFELLNLKITSVDSLQITPNPFQKRTKAFYSFSQNDTVSLTVYNQIGQVILSILTNSIMVSGNYQDSIIMDAFPDGMYFPVLKLGTRKNINKKIIKSSTAGINEIELNKTKLQVYPNPCADVLKISLGDSKGYEIKVFDCTMKLVLSSPYMNSLGIINLENGVYFIEVITNENYKYHSKFIKE